MTERALWTPGPERIAASNLARFMAPLGFTRFEEVLRYSVEEPEAFWSRLWDFCAVKAETRGERIITDGTKMPGARFFPDARLNYAENMLRRSDDGDALVFRGEDRVKRRMSWAELNKAVAKLNRAFAAAGVKAGDRICAIVPNMPESIIAFLAASSLGAIWSSCSPDFGERGILDRFGQIAPKILITCDGYYYAGKTIRMGEKVGNVLKELPSVERALVIDYIGEADEVAKLLPGGQSLADFVSSESDAPISFAQLPPDHPLYILYSSGTTGIPKCIVHGAGGILLKHLSEHVLNTDTRPSDKLFYFSTCGWMMWNWLVSGLGAGATLLLYDGSPFHPSERVLFDYADDEGMTIFGTSAKYIDAVKKSGLMPKETHRLDSLRAMLSTGSPLSAESFDFVYAGIKQDIQLASISGGTDICGCFVGGNPLSPVWRGEIQGAMMGVAVDVYDETGRPVRGEKGELVCVKPFPSMPVMFWNDPDGSKYHNAYFARFPGIWCHGDFAEITPHDGMIIHGRSDATLNPGGVRIGTAEIYAQVEQVPEVIEAIAIGQDWDGDVRVVLFLRLRPGVTLDDALVARIKKKIRDGASPRHVPAKVIAIADIPRTKSGKITELAVRDVVHGREVKNKEALANPEALDLFAGIAELQR
ncbi:acetoacetate--CoA ligase [Aestuariivirga litoralis]|uniref:Acetoacetate--CoA ligase n=1 Tax=Aestuariivirga litoralis TaxID=2650924 RepID=A0A2W2BLL6_9HYPH|nr:acetoacetate--CoA ligase [Aestuariivirga litoralis]PZF76737.1 acetoacetate--CoA ligase [Aestuariivirga litoralis]